MVPLIRAEIRGVELSFETAPGVFSPRFVDPGTRALIEAVELRGDDRLLDLGCGYGAIGIWAARALGPERVVMVDASEEALGLARANARRNGVGSVRIERSDGFRDLRESGFTAILCNPPYHVDFSVPRHFIERGFNRLVPGGRLYLVTKRETWYRNKLGSVFGGARAWRRDGYTVLMSEKRGAHYARVGGRGAGRA